jgi:glycine cleavage system H lipoate-binding protein
MFPWVYEFHWSVFHVTFLVIFFTVFATVILTVIKALRRSSSDFATSAFEKILWHSEFEDLSPASKVCRHEITGDFKHRICDNELDCRTCPVHAKIVELQQGRPKSSILEFESLGFVMPPYRQYHRGHTWVQEENDGTFKVGLDDFGERLVGNPDYIDLPPIGSTVRVNGTGWNVKKGNAKLRILSPLDGTVIEHGDREKGWMLKVKASDSKNPTGHLLHGSEIRPWLTREMERLQMSFATSGIGVTLADGGELEPDFHRYYPNADWDGILGQMFLEA